MTKYTVYQLSKNLLGNDITRSNLGVIVVPDFYSDNQVIKLIRNRGVLIPVDCEVMRKNGNIMINESNNHYPLLDLESNEVI